MSSAPSPRVVRSPEEFRLACEQVRTRGMRVGFVPTMGALHEGHLALVREARSRTEWVAVSIFVNPTQFGPKEDLAKYPRDLEGDCAKVASAGADLVFAPEVAQMYVPGDETRVRVGALAEPLCGAFRPGHFEGVATVVTKLLALSGPCTAIFGEKDFQQLAVIRRLVADLFLPVEVVGYPIVREPDGLAMSSRNAYLSAEDRKRALCIYAGLSAARGQYQCGERRVGPLRALVVDAVKSGADAVDYITLADAKTLRPLEEGQRLESPAVLAIACRVGTTRLIDNMIFGEDLTGSGAS